MPFDTYHAIKLATVLALGAFVLNVAKVVCSMSPDLSLIHGV